MKNRKLIMILTLNCLITIACSTSRPHLVPDRETAAAEVSHLLNAYDDQSPEICPLHHVRTRLRLVPVLEGMCLAYPDFEAALLAHFPHSYLSLRTCTCLVINFPPVLRRVCPVCLRNERLWRLFHRHHPPLPKQQPN